MAKKKLWTELIEERQKKKYHVHELSSDRKKIKYLESLVKAHPYWDKMPTLRDDKVQNIFGNIEGKREVKDVRKEPLPLPSDSYSWCEIDLMDIKQLDEVNTL